MRHSLKLQVLVLVVFFSFDLNAKWFSCKGLIDLFKGPYVSKSTVKSYRKQIEKIYFSLDKEKKHLLFGNSHDRWITYITRDIDAKFIKSSFQNPISPDLPFWMYRGNVFIDGHFARYRGHVMIGDPLPEQAWIQWKYKNENPVLKFNKSNAEKAIHKIIVEEYPTLYRSLNQTERILYEGINAFLYGPKDRISKDSLDILHRLHLSWSIPEGETKNAIELIAQYLSSDAPLNYSSIEKRKIALQAIVSVSPQKPRKGYGRVFFSTSSKAAKDWGIYPNNSVIKVSSKALHENPKAAYYGFEVKNKEPYFEVGVIDPEVRLNIIKDMEVIK